METKHLQLKVMKYKHILRAIFILCLTARKTRKSLMAKRCQQEKVLCDLPCPYGSSLEFLFVYVSRVIR